MDFLQNFVDYSYHWAQSLVSILLTLAFIQSQWHEVFQFFVMVDYVKVNMHYLSISSSYFDNNICK